MWLILLVFGGRFYFLRSVVCRDFFGNGEQERHLGFVV
jgi:hypothetical protein